MRRVAIILPTWLGDAVMATPAIEAIRRHYGGSAELIGVMRPLVSELLAGTEWFDDSVLYDRKSDEPDRRIRAVGRRLRDRKVDTVFIFPNSLSTAWLAFLSRATRRIGYSRSGRGLLLTHGLQPARRGRRFEPVSAVDYYLELARSVGCSEDSKRLALAVLPEDEQEADGIWNRLGLSASREVVLLNTGSANSTARDWPLQSFAQLAREIVEQRDASVLVLCGPAEETSARSIVRLASHPRVHSMAEENLALGVAKACIRRGSLLVTTDSGPRHIAGAFGIPVVTLSGPIDPRWSYNYHPADSVIQNRVACLPCDQNECPLGNNICMQELRVDQVLDLVLSQLERPQGRRIA